MKKSKEVSLGSGVLNWERSERVSDRYGTVSLYVNTDQEESVDLKEVSGYGELKAKIIETRDSYHIGDLFRGFQPGGAKVGDEIVLGQGNLFFVDWHVGLEPLKPRNRDWLNPKALYKCHFQTVELFFTPKKKPSKTKKPTKNKTEPKAKKKINLPQKGAGRKLAAKLKKLGKQVPPQSLVKKINKQK